MDLKESLPQIYRSLLPESFLSGDAEVKKATCQNCFMADPERSKGRYLKDIKCCTYYPFIPNYLVGEILSAGGEGADVLKGLLKHRQYALPIGIVPPPSYRQKIRGNYDVLFGRDPAFLCPFYVWKSGGCSIWKNRNSQCSTYFCTYDENGPNEKAWSDVQEVLHYLEIGLSQWCLLEKGYTAREISVQVDLLADAAMKSAPTSYQLDALSWKSFWLHHLDDVEGFYLACARIVQHKGEQYLREDQTWIKDKKPLLMNFPNLKTGKIGINALSK